MYGGGNLSLRNEQASIINYPRHDTFYPLVPEGDCNRKTDNTNHWRRKCITIPFCFLKNMPLDILQQMQTVKQTLK